MEKLKQKLKDLELVIDNEFLDKYVEIITLNKNTSKKKFKTDAHHIVPAFYYRANNTPVDNKENVVNLLAKDHILAHMYLALCATDKYKGACSSSVGRLVTGHEGEYSKIEEAIDILDFDLLQKISEQRKAAISEASKCRKPNKNKIWIHNGEINKLILPSDFSEYSDKGFVKGRLPLPQDGIEKMRRSRKGQKPSKENIEKRVATYKKRIETGDLVISVSEETRQQISETLLSYYKENEHASKGKIVICNEALKIMKYIVEEEFPCWEIQGWRKGRLKSHE